MTTGIGSRMYGTVEWMHAPVTPLTCPGLSSRTCIALAGRELSLDDLISATCEYLEGCFLRKTYTALFVIFSCAISTFSDPLITK